MIFVIDSTDRKNDMMSKGELFKLVINEKLAKAVFLVLGNKQDVEGAMREEEIMAAYSLGEIKNHSWHLGLTSATEGKGLKEGLDWLTDQLVPPK